MDTRRRRIMSEILDPREPMYPGGSMTAWDFVQAEVEIDETMPGWNMGDLPYTKIQTPYGDFLLHCLNTTVVKYPKIKEGDKGIDWSHMCHIIMDDETQYGGPIYIFRSIEGDGSDEENWVNLARHLLKMDFPLLVPYTGTPTPEVMYHYWRGVRGGQPMDGIIRKIIEEADGVKY
jgi:hypothetical protein